MQPTMRFTFFGQTSSSGRALSGFLVLYRMVTLFEQVSSAYVPGFRVYGVFTSFRVYGVSIYYWGPSETAALYTAAGSGLLNLVSSIRCAGRSGELSSQVVVEFTLTTPGRKKATAAHVLLGNSQGPKEWTLSARSRSAECLLYYVKPQAHVRFGLRGC